MIHGKTVGAVVPADRVERQIGGALAAMSPKIDLIIVVDDPPPDPSDPSHHTAVGSASR